MLYRSPHDFPELRHFPRRARERVLAECGREPVPTGTILLVLPVALGLLIAALAAASLARPHLNHLGALVAFGVSTLTAAVAAYQVALHLFRRRVRARVAPISFNGELLQCLDCGHVLDQRDNDRCPACGHIVYDGGNIEPTPAPPPSAGRP